MHGFMNHWKALAGIGLALLAVNVVLALYPLRVDTTVEHRFTLTDGTLRVLHGLTQAVTVEVFMSRSVTGLPPSLQSYCDYVDKILGEYERNSGGRIRLRQFDPIPGSAAEERAMRSGMQFEELRPGDAASRFCLGICFRRLGRADVSLRQLVTGGYNGLEYDVTRALLRISSDRPVSVGIMSSMPVFGGIDAERQKNIPEWSMVTALRESGFQVSELPERLGGVSEDIDILLLVHPANIAEETLRAIDGFVQRGGRLLAFLDSGCWTAAMYRGGGTAFSSLRPSSLNEVTQAWGVTFEKDQAVLDKSLATIVLNKKSVPENHIEWLTMSQKNMAVANPVTAFLNKVEFYQCGFFTASPVDGLTAEALMESSENAQNVTVAQAFRHQRALLRDYAPGGKRLCLGISLAGTFPSAFDKGLFSKPTQVMLFSDADCLHDNFTRDRKTDNMQLLLNCADCLRETDDGLLRLRNRTFTNRTLTWLAQKEGQDRRSYQKKLDEFQKVRDQLAVDAAALEKANGGKMYSDAEGDRLKAMYDQLMAADLELRGLQIAANKRMEGHRQRIVMMNFLLGPGVLLLLMLGIPLCRLALDNRRAGLRRIAWLAGCLLAVVAVVWCTRQFGGNAREQTESVRGNIRLLTAPLKRDALVKVEMSCGDWKTAIVRDGDSWTVEGKDGYPADVRQLNAFLEAVNVCTGEELTVGPDDAAAIALDGTGCTVRLLEAGGRDCTLVFGDWRRNYANEAQGRYVRNDAGQALLTGYRFSEIGSAGAWLQKDIPGFNAAAKRLVRESEFKELSWGLDRRQGGYEVRGKIPLGYAVNDAVVKNIVASFQRVKALDVQKDVAGFSPETRLTLVGGDDVLYEYEIGQANGRHYVHLLNARSAADAATAETLLAKYGKVYLEVSDKVVGAFKRNRKELFMLKR